MTVGTLVDSDRQTSVLSDLLRADLSGRALTVHLYHSSISPDPSTSAATFGAEEATFDSYVPLPISAAWQLPLQIQPGEWAIVNGPFAWPAPTSQGDTIYGMWIQDDANNVYMSYEFTTPISYQPGSSPLTFNVQHNQWARVLLPGPF